MLTFSEWQASNKDFGCPVVSSISGYHQAIQPTVMYPKDQAGWYLWLGLWSEFGEMADVVKKAIRSGQPVNKDRLVGELGDFAWYVVEAFESITFAGIYDSFNLNVGFLLESSFYDEMNLVERLEALGHSLQRNDLISDLVSRYKYNIRLCLGLDEDDKKELFTQVENSSIWFDIQLIAKYFDVTLLDVLNYNIYKLYERLKTNTIKEHNDNG